MKIFKTLLMTGFTLMLSVGVAHAVDLDDLDVTIRVIDSDDVDDISHELSLPFPASAAGRGHEEGGLSHVNDVRGDDHVGHQGSDNEQVAENKFDDRGEGREQSEDEAADRDESREDIDDAHEERDDAEEQEQHENEQEAEERKDSEGVADPLPEVPDIPGTPDDK
ncbi:MAG: hypothetical protein GXP17_05570 [Gammaproteobacteria bacterium]|nr:hypothetical protein [Gammaproteobacteria bacterium]